MGDRRSEIVVFVGIQASGKTTFYRERLAGTHEHVSLDLLGRGGNVRRKEERQLESALSAGRDVVIDNTNTTRETRKRYFELARRHGALVVGYYFEEPLAACLERNARREAAERVPEAALRAFQDRLEPPVRDEGFFRLFMVRIGRNAFDVSEMSSGPVGGSADVFCEDA